MISDTQMDSSMGPQTNHQPFPNSLAPQTVYALQAVGQPANDESQQYSLRIRSILGALRRRWFVATTLGLILSTSAAAGVWYAIPDSYTAFAELIVKPDERFLYSTNETREVHESRDVYKQTIMRLATYPFVLTAALRDENLSNCPTLRQRSDPESWLAENLNVSSPATQFIRISLDGDRPADLELIVNGVVTAFEDEVIDRDSQKERDDLEAIRAELRQKEKELNGEVEQITKRRQRIALADQAAAEARYETHTGFNLELNKQIAQVEWEILQTEIELGRLLAAKSKPVAIEEGAADEPAGTGDALTDQPEASPDPGMLQPLMPDIKIPENVIEAELQTDQQFLELNQSLERAEQKLRLYEKRYQSSNPKITEVRLEVANANGQIQTYRAANVPEIRQRFQQQILDQLTPREEAASPPVIAATNEGTLPSPPVPQPDPILAAEQTLEKLKSNLKLYEEKQAAFKVETEDLSAELIQLQLLDDEVALLKAEVNMLRGVENTRESELAYKVEHPPVELKRAAKAPSSPEQGTRIKMSAMAGLGVLGLVFAGIVFLEYSAHRLNSVSEVQSDLKLQVMSTIPLMPRWIDSQDDPSSSQKSAYWHSVLTESVDAARTLLLKHTAIYETKVVLIGSATGGEGKTTLSCHLATSLARSGRSVLLIDGDLRRPSIHKVYDLDNEAGLCELLLEEAEIEDCLHDGSPAGLSILTAGRVNSSVLRALAQDRLGQLLGVVREKFDFVIIDTSPILPVTDALLMAQYADGVLFSLRRDVSRTAKVSAAVRRLSMLGIDVLGAVAIGLDDGPANQPYSYYNYGYGYGANPHSPTNISSPRGR